MVKRWGWLSREVKAAAKREISIKQMEKVKGVVSHKRKWKAGKGMTLIREGKGREEKSMGSKVKNNKKTF